MQIGMIGLGRMGANMRTRLQRAGHDVVGYDQDQTRSDTADLAGLAAVLPRPRTIWVMVPSGGPTRDTVAQLADVLETDDLVVDGGNSHWSEDDANAQLLHERGMRYVDCGVSGGVWGLENGFALMMGGAADDVERLLPVVDALRPEGPRAEGFSHAGPVGAGHFAKMVHNGIEYGLMQAYAEGFELLTASDVVTDVPSVLRAWSRGTVVRSWLLDLLVQALDDDPGLERIRGYAEDSGEGRWSVQDAVDHAVPAPVTSAALFARFTSRQQDSPAMKAVAALRHQFGGHEVAQVSQDTQDTRGAGPTSGSGHGRG